MTTERPKTPPELEEIRFRDPTTLEKAAYHLLKNVPPWSTIYGNISWLVSGMGSTARSIDAIVKAISLLSLHVEALAMEHDELVSKLVKASVLKEDPRPRRTQPTDNKDMN
jgi:hypothetical protein